MIIFYNIGRVNHLMWKNGGPIIMVQVENEYAGYGDRLQPGNFDPGLCSELTPFLGEKSTNLLGMQKNNF